MFSASMQINNSRNNSSKFRPQTSSAHDSDSTKYSFSCNYTSALNQTCRHHMSLKCDKATQLSLLFRKLRKCSCVRMGVWQQILVLGCEMSHLLSNRTTDVCHCQQARQSAKSHASGDVYLVMKDCSTSFMTERVWTARTRAKAGRRWLWIWPMPFLLCFCIKI